MNHIADGSAPYLAVRSSLAFLIAKGWDVLIQMTLPGCVAAQTPSRYAHRLSGPNLGLAEKNMTTIVSGRFNSIEGAARAVSSLTSSGFLVEDISSFPVDPIDADLPKPPTIAAADRAGETIGSDSMTGVISGTSVGLVLGAASLPFVGPPGLIAGAAVGAYVGSLFGAVAGQTEAVSAEVGSEKTPPPATPMRPRITLVAVRAAQSEQQASAIDLLRAGGGVHIEKVEGNLRDGIWIDFDPMARSPTTNV